MTRWIYISALFCGLVLGPRVISATETSQPDVLLLTSHPLVDRVLDVRGDQLLDKSRLFEKLESAGYILLGEVHDNISHHRNEAEVIDYLATKRPAGSVAFEMIDDSQDKFIRGRQIGSADELIGLLKHTDSGWDYERNYRPVFESVIRAGFRIFPANIERNRLMKIVMRQGSDVADETARILSATRFTPETESQMQNDIIDAHCNMLDAEQAAPMVEAQRIRDATMAASLLKNVPVFGVLIAGNGHVRNDSGVPRYIHAQDGTVPVISVAMVEVEEDQDDPAAYAAGWGDDGLPFDYVWFTPRVEREDPCIEFVRQHKKQD